MSDVSEIEADNINDPVIKKRKKGERNVESYIQNVIKRRKVKGQEHINHVGKLVAARKTGFACR